MGGLISRWRQAKPSTVEVLEKIDKEIQTLEEFREKNQRLQKLWVGRLLLYSSLLYLITCIIVYLWCLPDEWTARLMMTLPFFAFPLIIWFIRTLLIFFFSKRTERNNDALEDLKSQKKKILEEVMEKETYKTAKLILERFDPESSAKEAELPSAGTSATPRPGQEIRQRTTAQRNASTPPPVTPKQGSPKSLVPASPNLQRDTSALSGPPERTVVPSLQSNVLPRHPGSPATSVPGMGLHPPGPPLARPILPRERGVVDRVIEYLVGDGPQNRYALICQQCFSHNGMALKEEFEYIAFRCAYCFFLNPARKTRPQAPRLPDFSFEKKQSAELPSETEPLEPREGKPQETQQTEDSEEDTAQIVETNETDNKALSPEQLNDKLAEEVEKEAAENISTTEDTISESISAEQSEESLVKAE
ncbi:endoplasmic reticulum junction formation protein lunapark isoform X1 [Harpia harpyja]|uniref:endoplasmic reticulum junction formation protein lunapark isoform X1 n=1 Tax=Harpia harpyja TaxID=202280 RepID=UPI0022B1C4D5|nr:endoplasmic reticulum junction formation protein lunapark isoform X1 [Harpia harpyja]XP_052647310.1 endoplasmic reticulum junction formation protein lunapark isoform X1 [Harpia harpyja]XP_052647312.1 endoplasmic reticulum junction formation protein lunapark isoform X1 [Harpia harpyja]XP_052647313.1 endoplasmic reticulum junction formation protein lunapark isoform X1 [Harpia harpyja]XP_052647314.1 endoplasmic reticulum junction formation protein lunapark isoform X1 [Harpia harpyja]